MPGGVWSGADLESLEARQLLANAVAVAEGNVLVEFDLSNPSVILRATPITGLGAGEVMSTIDFHPGTEKLYGIPSGSRTPVYTIDRQTGVATRVGPGVPFGFPTTQATGLAYDELNGYLRYVDETFGNYRLDPDSGLQLRNDAGQEGLAEIAYRPLNGDPENFAFYGVNHVSNELMELDPERMTVFAHGPLGVDIDRHAGLDVAPDGTVYLAARIGGVSRFGYISPEDGHSYIDLGTIGNGTQYAVRGMAVEPLRHAPVLTPTGQTPTLGLISEDHVTNAGVLISSLIASGGAGFITDANASPLQGVAIVGTSAAAGTWQYTLDGANWSPVGAVSDQAGLLLPASGTARIRLAPAANFNGVVAQAVRFRAWDQSAGAPGQKVALGNGGGESAFSVQSAWASIEVLPVRDAPTIQNPPPAGGSFVINDTQTVRPLQSATIGYVDNAARVLTVTVSLNDAAAGDITPQSLAAAGFTVVDAAGEVYRFTGTAAAATAAVRQLVYQPAQNAVAVGQTTLSFLVLRVDDGLGVGTQVFSPFIAAKSVREAPTVAISGGTLSVSDRGTVAPFTGATIGYAEAGSPNLTVDVMLGGGVGAFTPESLAASGFALVHGATGTYRFIGTAAAATAAIRKLVYKPAENMSAAGTTRSLKFDVYVRDGHEAGTAPAHASSPTVEVMSENDRPTMSGIIVTHRIKFRKTVKPFRNVVLGDVDPNARLQVDVRVNTPRKGLMTAASLNNAGFVRIGHGRYRFFGTAAEATAAVRKLKYGWQPKLNYYKDHAVKIRLSITDELGGFRTNNQTTVRLRR